MQGQVTHKDAYLSKSPTEPLSQWVQCFWQLNVPAGNFNYRSVPDNCVDLIINLNCPEEIFLIAPFSSATIFEMYGPACYFGIRFRLLAQQGIVTRPIGDWQHSVDGTPAAEVLSNVLLERLIQSCRQPVSFENRCRQIESLLIESIKSPNLDPRLLRFVRYCSGHLASDMDISDRKCSEFGLSARQLRRLSHLYLGLSPREFCRIMRFQHALRKIQCHSDVTPWADCYYDQPHFIREFKQLSGVTPSEFKSLSVLYNH